MSNSSVLSNSCILLAGSISNSTDDAQIEKAHAFVDALVKEVIDAGGCFVAYCSAEPVNSNQKPLLFDWTVVRAINRLIPGDSTKVRLKIVASRERVQHRMSKEQRQIFNGLIARGIAEHIMLDEDILTGSNIGAEQIEHATAMIALGGGKGVVDRAHKMVKQSLPVLPLDLQLGANKEDGNGALIALEKFYSDPLRYMPNTGSTVVKILSSFSLEEPVLDFAEIARRIVNTFYKEELARVAALPPDVLILTALPVELAAAKQAFGVAEDIQHTTTDTGLHFWKAPVVRFNGETVHCVIACFGGPGNVDASSITSTLLSELKPSNVIMLGIGAGMRDKCALGEVILAERIVAYEGAAFIEGGKVEARPESIRLNLRSRQDISSYLANEASLENRLSIIYKDLDITFPEQVGTNPVAKDLLPKTATVGSGEKLMRDPEKFKSLRELNGKTEVVDMEGAGVFAACANHEKSVMMFRGISDFGDSTKDNLFHKLASKAAAAVTVDYIANGLTLYS